MSFVNSFCFTYSRCFECGELGHLSYSCPKNILGAKEPPKKKRKRKLETSKNATVEKKLKNDSEEEIDEMADDFEDESLSAAIKYQVRFIINLCLFFHIL